MISCVLKLHNTMNKPNRSASSSTLRRPSVDIEKAKVLNTFSMHQIKKREQANDEEWQSVEVAFSLFLIRCLENVFSIFEVWV